MPAATTPAELIARSMSENALKAGVIEAAIKFGWRVAHFRPARTEHGWRTPMEGHPGFPDLVLAKNGCVIFAELKSHTGKVAPEQQSWLRALDGEHLGPFGVGPGLHSRINGGWILIAVWRPEDWLCGEILELLGGGQAPGAEQSGSGPAAGDGEAAKAHSPSPGIFLGWMSLRPAFEVTYPPKQDR